MTIHTVGHIWRDKMTVRECLEGLLNQYSGLPSGTKMDDSDVIMIDHALSAIAEIVEGMRPNPKGKTGWHYGYEDAITAIATLIRGQKL